MYVFEWYYPYKERILNNDNNMSILLVDDDQALLRLLTIRLEQQGYQIISTDDGAKALQLLQQFQSML